MLQKLKVARVTTGALVAKAKINHFAMAHIKGLNLHPLYIMQPKIRLFIFAVVSKVLTSLYVMAHTAVFNFLPSDSAKS
jgi:hypothetical protein